MKHKIEISEQQYFDTLEALAIIFISLPVSNVEKGHTIEISYYSEVHEKFKGRVFEIIDIEVLSVLSGAMLLKLKTIYNP